ncbi:MAG: hypothetical protein Q7U04_15395 [Bacteriovorax sp.]|nr:hypothetical protein [Bacteriovorax sp.]
MKYETLENVLMKELRLLRKTLIIVLAAFGLITSVVLFSKNKIFLQAGAVVSTRPLLTYVCKEAFLSIARSKPINAYLTPEIQNALKKADFKVEVDEVLLNQEIDEGKCRIIVKGGERVRSFLINLVKSSDFDFYYKLSEINEIEVNKDELKSNGGEK